MDPNKIDELLKLLGTAFKDYEQGREDITVVYAIKNWMDKNAPEYLK